MDRDKHQQHEESCFLCYTSTCPYETPASLLLCAQVLAGLSQSGQGFYSSGALTCTRTYSSSHWSGALCPAVLLELWTVLIDQRALGKGVTCLHRWCKTGLVILAFAGFRKDETQIIATWNSFTARPGRRGKQLLSCVASTASSQRSFCMNSGLWQWLWVALHHLSKQNSSKLWAGCWCWAVWDALVLISCLCFCTELGLVHSH